MMVAVSSNVYGEYGLEKKLEDPTRGNIHSEEGDEGAKE
jgi:hypothetical protein